jgi:signal transduction histidine kinase
MIDSLLDFSKLTQNLPPPKDVDLNVLIETIILELESSKKDKIIHFNLPTTPIILNTYYSLISQLFLNLISNSIKFSKESEINTISITWNIVGQEYLKFQVIDTGVGIPDDIKPTIFKLFSKYSSNGDNSGNGIGLSTCSRVVSFLGGQINVESEEGKGTKMIFTVKINSVSNSLYNIHGT